MSASVYRTLELKAIKNKGRARFVLKCRHFD